MALTRGSRAALGFAFALAATSTALPASADPIVSPTNQAAAQSLFEEARSLVAQGKHEQACKKFEESQRLDPGGGTLLNLALCHEEIGKTATAWAEFNEAYGIALRDGRDVRVKIAKEHISKLEPKLSRLQVLAPEASKIKGLQIRLDGVVLGEAAWGTPTPLDPGSHEVEASAAGYKGWKTNVDIAPDGARAEVAVPMLEKLPPPPPEPPGKDRAAGAAPAETMSSTRRAVGYGLVATGAVTVALGAVFGLVAMSNKSESDQACPKDDACTARGVAANDSAIRNSWISTAGFGIGVVSLGIGGYLLMVKPSKGGPQIKASAGARSHRPVVLAPTLGSGRLGVSLEGAF